MEKVWKITKKSFLINNNQQNKKEKDKKVSEVKNILGMNFLIVMTKEQFINKLNDVKGIMLTDVKQFEYSINLKLEEINNMDWIWIKASFELNGLSKLILAIFIKIVLLLIAVAYFTIAERKVMAAIQRRRGPNVVGILGLGQPLADGAKLLVKEVLIPTRADNSIFLLAPIMILVLSILNWSLIPGGLWNTEECTNFYNSSETNITTWQNILEKWQVYQTSVSDITYGVLLILAISGLNVYGIIMAGWSSNSKYAFLGGLRSAAQMISYEVSLGLLLLPIILLAGSLNLTDIVMAQKRTVWFFLPLFPCAWMFFISILAETNRAPFDLPEAEAELVAGYNVEYSSIIFAMFFLGEYTNMLLMATIMVLFFFGGWLPIFGLEVNMIGFWLSLKILIFCHMYILIRAGLPRLRYDQLMELGWKVFLPLSLAYLLYVIGILYIFDGLPQVFEIYSEPHKEFLIF